MRPADPLEKGNRRAFVICRSSWVGEDTLHRGVHRVSHTLQGWVQDGVDLGKQGHRPTWRTHCPPLFPHLWKTLCTSCAVNGRCGCGHVRAIFPGRFRWERAGPAGARELVATQLSPEKGVGAPTRVDIRCCPQDLSTAVDKLHGCRAAERLDDCPAFPLVSRGGASRSPEVPPAPRRCVRQARGFLHPCGQLLSTACARDTAPGRDDVSSPLHKTGSTGYLRAVVARWDERHGERHAHRGKNVSSSCPGPP